MIVGTIDGLWRFPVKSFQGEKVDRVELEKQGIRGDRAYALIDKETGKVVTAKSVKLFPGLLNCAAVYLQPPKIGREIPPVQITLADGTTVVSNSENIDQTLSVFFGRAVTLARVADDYTIHQYQPDIENPDPTSHRDTFTEQKPGSALASEIAAGSPFAPGSFVDFSPVSVISTSTLDHLHQLRPETNFDIRRFRMNILVKTNTPGFAENSWVGNTIAIGNSVRLTVTMPDSRCVMTTLAQNGIPKDTNVLKTLVKYNSLDIMGSGNYPCAGVYATIATKGSVSINDTVDVG